LARFELTVNDLGSGQIDERFRRLMKFEVERARGMFTHGNPLCTSVTGRLGLELRSVWLGGMRILERIEEANYDVFGRRPVITSGDKLRILLSAATRAGFGRY